MNEISQIKNSEDNYKDREFWDANCLKYKGYHSMARRFHPENNFGFDTSEMMKMINTAREGLQDQLRKK